jgi:molecular chaperone HscB
MNYFELFDIKPTLKPDKKLISTRYFELQKKYHPDFFSQESEEEQAKALEKSSMINKAWKVFNDTDETIKYVLQLKGLLEEEEKYQLPPDFLMEMMELNEKLAEAKMEGDSIAMADCRLQIADWEEKEYDTIKEIVEHYQEGITSKEELLQVKEYYFKKKYLRRLAGQLNGMA